MFIVEGLVVFRPSSVHAQCLYLVLVFNVHDHFHPARLSAVGLEGSTTLRGMEDFRRKSKVALGSCPDALFQRHSFSCISDSRAFSVC